MKLLSLIVVFILNSVIVSSINFCDNWSQYKDSKCITVVQKSVNHDQAVKECLQLDNKASLVSIHNKEEQDFVDQLINKFSNISDYAWIGLEYNIENKIFEWKDGSALDYENWNKDAIKNGEVKCVRMLLKTDELGQWTDESCSKNSLVVCQKNIVNNLDILTKAINNLTQQISELKTDQVKQITELRNDQAKQITGLKADQANQYTELKTNQAKLIPIGFIYTQLPDQSDPKSIWPAFEWQDVTSEYAGLFFRAEGGDSEKFGNVQNFNTQRFVSVETKSYLDELHCNTNPVTLAPGQKSEFIYSGDGGPGSCHGLSFTTSPGEIRPINKAIKIWKRKA